jgi:hypothetical protein
VRRHIPVDGVWRDGAATIGVWIVAISVLRRRLRVSRSS